MTRIISIIIVVFLSGCIDEKNNDSSNVDSFNKVDGNIETTLLGVWKTSCVNLEEGKYVKFVRSIKTKYVTYLEYYNNSDCGELITRDYPIVSDYKLGNALVSDDGLTVYEFDSHILDVSNLDPSKYSIDTSFDIIYIVDNKLYFGKPTDNSSRPTKLNFDEIFYKE